MLTLVPTPINDHATLDNITTAYLQSLLDPIFLVENINLMNGKFKKWNIKATNLISYNEHNMKDISPLIDLLKKGKDLYLFSDGGMPAINDPGFQLVDACHKLKIKVTATPFSNSIILALALSGFNCKKFNYQGYLSPNNDIRYKELSLLLKDPTIQVIIDTPYRLKNILKDLSSLKSNRLIFLACNLNTPKEKLFRLPSKELLKLNLGKCEFVLVINAIC